MSDADSANFILDTRGGFPTGVAYSGYFRLDTRLSGSAGDGNSADFSLDTRGATIGTALVSGRVTETSGAVLSGSMVSALHAGLLRATAICDGSGNYQLPLLPAGIYELRVAKSGWLTSVRSSVSVAASSQQTQNFALVPRPAGPPVQVVARTPEPGQTPALRTVTSTQLKLFVSSSDSFQSGQSLDTGKMTVVITHGWNSDPNVWAKPLAKAMVAKSVNANLCAWDWSGADGAGTGLGISSLGRAVERMPRQAETLALALQSALGGSQYQKPLHFIGHSLGTMVNGMAANILHGEASWKSGPQVLDPARTHLTLLDDAELAVNGDFDPFYAPIPQSYAWVDNYFTFSGRYRANAVNVYLGRGNLPLPFPFAELHAHAYPYDWYRLTVGNPIGCALGFRFSFEQTGDNASFPTPTPFAYGTFFKQDPSPFADELALILPPTPEEVAALIAKNARAFANRSYQAVVNTVQGTVQSVGEVTSSVVEKFFRQGSETEDGIDGTPVWSFLIGLRTQPAAGLVSAGLRTADVPAGNTPAQAWVTLAVPTNATTMVFDFTLSGEGSNDVFVAGINGTNVFAQEARLLPQGLPVGSGPIEVAQWAGQTVEVFFGVMGGTSTNAAVAIDGIRFQEAFRPPVQVARTGSGTAISWPLSAQGFLLESATTFSGTNLWSTVTNAPSVEDFDYTVTNAVSGGARFFRLRKP